MYKYIFHGVVHPKSALFHLDGLPKEHISLPEISISGQIVGFAKDSEMQVIFETDTNLLDHQDKDILITLKNTMGQYGELFIDIYCFLKSYNYDLEIFRVECKELNLDTTFDVQLETDLKESDNPDLEAKIISNKMNEITHLILGKHDRRFLDDVFSDYKRGIKYPKETGFYFYRGLEAIKKNAFNDSWNEMNQALNFKESHYSDLNLFRKPNAHGTFPSISSTQRIKLAKDTRKVIDSFVQYLSNKDSGL